MLQTCAEAHKNKLKAVLTDRMKGKSVSGISSYKRSSRFWSNHRMRFPDGWISVRPRKNHTSLKLPGTTNLLDKWYLKGTPVNHHMKVVPNIFSKLSKSGQNLLSFLEAGRRKTASCSPCQPGHQPIALGRPMPMEGHTQPFGDNLFGALL